MPFLLDTNVVSELRRLDRIDPRALVTIDRIPPQDSFVSVISLMEIEKGIRRKARRDRDQALILSVWFGALMARYAPDRILSFDLDMALCCAALHIPDPRGHNDAMIAATALVRGLTLVTRNVADFSGTDVPLLNPWNA